MPENNPLKDTMNPNPRLRNTASVTGIVKDAPEADHVTCSEVFYRTKLSVRRTSGRYDLVPVLIPERLLTRDAILALQGAAVRIDGQFRSYERSKNGHTYLIRNLFALEICILPEPSCQDVNYVRLEGALTGRPEYRVTPYGREITDFNLSVNRGNGKADTIACIAWSRNARFINSLKEGTPLRVTGRIQSRSYSRRTDNGGRKGAAYEISAGEIWQLAEPEPEYGGNGCE